jgi:DNA primase
MDILRDAGLTVKVLVLSDMKDPDEFVRKHGREAFLEAARSAAPFIDFKLTVARNKHDLAAAEGSVAFLREAAGILRTLSPVESDYYIKKLSADTGIAEGAIRMETWGDHASGGVAQNAFRDAPFGGAEPSQDAYGNAARRTFADPDGSKVDRSGYADKAALAIQRNLIRLVLYDGSFTEEVRAHSRIFVTPALYRIFEHICALTARDPDADTDVKALEDMLDDDDRQALADIMETVLLGEDPKRQLSECIAQAEIRALSEREKEILDVLAVSAGDEERMSGLMEQLKDIHEKIREIKDR